MYRDGTLAWCAPLPNRQTGTQLPDALLSPCVKRHDPTNGNERDTCRNVPACELLQVLPWDVFHVYNCMSFWAERTEHGLTHLHWRMRTEFRAPSKHHANCMKC